MKMKEGKDDRLASISNTWGGIRIGDWISGGIDIRSLVSGLDSQKMDKLQREQGDGAIQEAE